jgi:hypothetical protein
MLMVKASEYDSPQSISSAKRKKGEAEDLINGLVSKKQRTRVRYGHTVLQCNRALIIAVSLVENVIAGNRRYFSQNQNDLQLSHRVKNNSATAKCLVRMFVNWIFLPLRTYFLNNVLSVSLERSRNYAKRTRLVRQTRISMPEFQDWNISLNWLCLSTVLRAHQQPTEMNRLPQVGCKGHPPTATMMLGRRPRSRIPVEAYSRVASGMGTVLLVVLHQLL